MGVRRNAVEEVLRTMQNPCTATHRCPEQDDRQDHCIMSNDHMSSDGKKGPYFTTREGVRYHQCCFGCLFLDDGSIIESQSKPGAGAE